MKKPRIYGNFFICLIINLLLNLEGAIPALILLALHYFVELPIWWFWGAISLWVVSMLIWMGIIRSVNRCSNMPEKVKENKNPYSHRKSD